MTSISTADGTAVRIGATTMPTSEPSESSLPESTPPTPLSTTDSSPQPEPKAPNASNVSDNDLSGSWPGRPTSIDKETDVESPIADSDDEDVLVHKPEDSDQESVGTLRKTAKADVSVLDQIRSLQDKLFELERHTKVRPDPADREIQWEEEKERVGADQEKRRWEAERQRRTAAVIQEGASFALGKSWFSKVDNDLSRRISEELEYNEKLRKHRRRWERRNFIDQDYHKAARDPYHDHDDGDDSDHSTDGSDLSGAYEWRRRTLRNDYDWERENLEFQFERRRMKRRRKHVVKMQRKEEEERRIRASESARQEGSKEEDQPTPRPASVVEAEEPEVEPLPVRMWALPESNRVEWAVFKRLRRVEEKDSYAINILVGEPTIDYKTFKQYGTWYGKISGQAEKAQEHKVPVKQELITGKAPLPERIRIHSTQILDILAQIHGSEISSFRSKQLEPLVFIRPFKALFYYYPLLREWCQKLEMKFDLQNGTCAGDRPEAKTGSSEFTHSSTNEIRGNDVHNEESKEPVTFEPHPGTETKNGGEDGEGPDGEDPDDEATSIVALEHLQCLLKFIDSDISRKVDYLNSAACQKITFSDIWYLFKPGDEVIGSDGKQAYRIISVVSSGHKVIPPWRNYFDQSSAKSEETPITIKCVYVDFDGKQLGPVSKPFNIKRFEGERAVTSLEVYPLRFHPARTVEPSSGNRDQSVAPDCSLRQRLIDRGRKFLEVAGVKHMYYTGLTLETKDEVESQVVVDFETAFAVVEEHGREPWKPNLETIIGAPDEVEDIESCDAECCLRENIHDDSYVEEKRNEEYMGSLLPKTRDELPSVVIFPRLLRDTKRPQNALSDEDLAIMSYRVFGFVLRSRKWAKLDLTHLTDVHAPSNENAGGEGGKETEDDEEPKTAFDRLVLPDGHRKMILSLVAQHFRDKESSANKNDQTGIVRGKGKGLILLLHGAPGVGKTSTAEDALETNFALANRWGCILLLDEADVFLAERTKEDFIRNGLVAVFLRVLEYYAGILFLTTNRVGDFDEAFASRIHISLYYPELNQDNTVEVFKLNLGLIDDRFKAKKRKVNIEDLQIGAFAANYWNERENERWNGRQIRNACQTALALAEFEAQGNSHKTLQNPNAVVTLGVNHFRIVSDAYLEFTRYVRDIFGTHAARRAKESGLRAMWVDKRGDVIGAVGAKGGQFRLASLGQSSANDAGQQVYQGQQQPSAPPQQTYQGGTRNLATPAPSSQYLQPSYHQVQQPQENQGWNPPTTVSGDNTHPPQYQQPLAQPSPQAPWPSGFNMAPTYAPVQPGAGSQYYGGTAPGNVGVNPNLISAPGQPPSLPQDPMSSQHTRHGG
ncbi:uncharacterized protein BP5553_00408 [Venustampulla echinocandica]|uniref:AAA+ ATPase domain-containing protein n=1 Tax=Venustampulla echinocandica TaxID=2656787 RepID=A0A370TY26_9HELO|nr:uncharacterized protein BP5553_00408 [Venustampulla echinocandica]RDL40429.1 hypothetical protein BP5553_00408 [Venustampulla echinocandica]